ncbi:MAG: hypothetical protein J5854_02945 [Clostridia bacterium]|nr:hypothetical protein [Clostridia bacterium]
MRRLTAWIGIVLAAAGFALLVLSIWLNIYYLIPIGMILAAFIALLIAKRMPSDADKGRDAEPQEGEDARE